MPRCAHKAARARPTHSPPTSLPTHHIAHTNCLPKAWRGSAQRFVVHIRLHLPHHPHTLPGADAAEELCRRLTAGERKGRQQYVGRQAGSSKCGEKTEYCRMQAGGRRGRWLAILCADAAEQLCRCLTAGKRMGRQAGRQARQGRQGRGWAGSSSMWGGRQAAVRGDAAD